MALLTVVRNKPWLNARIPVGGNHRLSRHILLRQQRRRERRRGKRELQEEYYSQE